MTRMKGIYAASALLGALIQAGAGFGNPIEPPDFDIPQKMKLDKGGKLERSKRHTGHRKIQREAKRIRNKKRRGR